MNNKRLVIEEKNDNRFLVSIGYCDGEHICLEHELIPYISNYFSLVNIFWLGKSETIDETPKVSEDIESTISK
jgi:hypothetical protein